MDKKLCRECANYIRHYGLFEGKLRPVFCGHCLCCHKKRIQPDAPACEKFISGVSPEKEMVTKEYLTKKLLQHILEMDIWQESE